MNHGHRAEKQKIESERRTASLRRFLIVTRSD
jgi:hypothetical protein